MPNYFSPAQLKDQGFNIDEAYRTRASLGKLEAQLDETFEDLYERNSATLENILERSTGNVLVVAHAISLDTCTRKICAKPLRSEEELSKLFMNVGFCGMVMIEQNSKGTWTMKEPPIKPITSGGNKTFFWQSLQ